MGFEYQPVGYGDIAKQMSALGTFWGQVSKPPSLDAAKFQHTLGQDDFSNQLALAQAEATRLRVAMEQAGAARAQQKAITDLFMEFAKHGYTQGQDTDQARRQAMSDFSANLAHISDLRGKLTAPPDDAQMKYAAGLEAFKTYADKSVGARVDPSDPVMYQQMLQGASQVEPIKGYLGDERYLTFLQTYLTKRAQDPEAANAWYAQQVAAANPRPQLEADLAEREALMETLRQGMTAPAQQQPDMMSKLMPILMTLGLQPDALFGGQQQAPPNPFEGQALLGTSEGKEVYVDPRTYGGKMTTSEGEEYAAPIAGMSPEVTARYDAFNEGSGDKVQFNPLEPLGQAAKDYMEKMSAQQGQGNPLADALAQAMSGGGQAPTTGATMGGDMRSGQLGADVVVQRLMAESPEAQNMKQKAIHLARTRGVEVAQQYIDANAQIFSHYSGGIPPERLRPFILKHAGITEADLPGIQF